DCNKSLRVIQAKRASRQWASMLGKRAMREGSATPLAGATSEKSDRAVAATEEGVAPEEAPTPSTRTRGSSKKVRLLAQRAGQLFLVALAHVAAFAVDWLLVPTSYPVAAAYGLSLILAAHLLASPVVVA